MPKLIEQFFLDVLKTKLKSTTQIGILYESCGDLNGNGYHSPRVVELFERIRRIRGVALLKKVWPCWMKCVAGGGL